MADEREFEPFAEQAIPRLRRVAYAHCHDWTICDDAVQEALAKVYAKWSTVSLESGYSYARTTLVRHLISEARRGWRRHEVSVDAPPERGRAESDLAQQLDLHQALTRLPPRPRAVAILRYLEGLSTDETARVLGCSAGAVKRYAADARDRLRPLLEESSTSKARTP